ncbi:MAG TPA: agmatinase [Thermoanaerobaculia bacterium]
MNSPRALAAGRVTLIGLPFDENSSYLRGAADAPPLIREAFRSESSNPYSESGIDLSAPGLLADAGDVAPAAGKTTLAQIEDAVDRCLRQDLHPIGLGGDHAITYPILRAFGRKYPNLSLLHFDAHPDLYDEFSGSRFSHACPFARIMEERLVGRLVQVGIRAATAHQRAQASRFGVEMREMRDGPIREKLAFDTPLYISFDMDALDPAFAPGVSHPEPGGLSTRDALSVIAAISVPIVGADVVEFNPSRDRSGVTAMTAAKLVKEIAARMLETLPLLVTA